MKFFSALYHRWHLRSPRSWIIIITAILGAALMLRRPLVHLGPIPRRDIFDQQKTTQLIFSPAQDFSAAAGPAANFWRSLYEPLIWHGQDEQHFYHLILRPALPHDWWAAWQVIERHPPFKIKTVQEKITEQAWAAWPQRPLSVAGIKFSYPQGSPHGIYISLAHNSALKLYWRITVLNYNVENLWDTDPDNTDPAILAFYEAWQKNKSNWYDPAVQALVATNFQKVLLAAGLPDIVALLEIESADNHSKVFAPQSILGKALIQLGYQSLIIGTQEMRNPVAITTAILSRYPLQTYPSLPLNASTYHHFGLPKHGRFGRTARDIQIVSLNIANTKTFFFLQHWPAIFAKKDPAPILQIQQANKRILDYALACPPPASRDFDSPIKNDPKLSYPRPLPWCRPSEVGPSPALPKVILLGDFNTHVGTPALPERPWINLWDTIAPAERWESVWQGRPGTLAHIILSPRLQEGQGLQYVPGSFAVLRDFLLNVDRTPLRRQFLKEKKQGKTFYRFSGQGYSDHLPLFAAFNFFPPELPILPLHQAWQKVVPPPPAIPPRQEDCPPLRAEDLHPRQLGRCFTVDWRQHPRPLKTAGAYRHNYLPLAGQKLYLTMEQAWPLNPATSAEQIAWEENACLNRALWQKRGGHLAFAQGRLGFFKDGYALYLTSRHHFQLKHLSRRKAAACR